MGKRKLSKQQKHRIAENRAAIADAAGDSAVDEALFPGLVVSHFGGEVEVLELDDIDSQPAQGHKDTVRCHFRANLPTLVCGDHVYWRRATPAANDNGNDNDKNQQPGRPVNSATTGVIESIAERRSLLSRPRPYQDPKPVAANIDRVYIVIAPQPEPFTTLIDRYLIAAENAGLQAALVINKVDLLEDEDSESCRQLQQIEALYRQLEYPVFRFSAEDSGQWQQQVSAFSDDCANQRSILVGQSGVGKSSMINALAGSEQALTGDISSANEKGRHTTTTSQLYFLANGGQIIDSPGIREFGLWHLSENDIINGLPEFREFALQCRFRDCQHGKSKGCAVQAAIESGTINPSRSSSYQQIMASLESQ